MNIDSFNLLKVCVICEHHQSVQAGHSSDLGIGSRNRLSFGSLRCLHSSKLTRRSGIEVKDEELARECSQSCQILRHIRLAYAP